VAFENHAAYSASKAGLNALTRGMMIEWARHNIQVNSICPTVILTDMGKEIWGPVEKSQPMIDKTPLGRFGEPVEVADMALYLASPASGLVNGEAFLIDGGYSAT
jgi:NAD(P)-dependent dehydrogenase (short-subunit alcohol dehydrogenase family)